MMAYKKLETEEIALLIFFTALYACLCFIPAFPIIGSQSGSIPFVAMITPVIGMVLGPYLGVLSALMGGIVGLFFAASFSLPSFVSGIVTAGFSGMLHMGKRSVCSLLYLCLLLLFGFYPVVGPIWLYPPLMWFQIFWLLVLVSPLQSIASKCIANCDNNSKLFASFFIYSVTSTMAGQIAGSLMYELSYWPMFVGDVNFWRGIWRSLMWIYPIERIVIALGAAIIASSLYKTLGRTDLIHFLHEVKDR